MRVYVCFFFLWKVICGVYLRFVVMLWLGDSLEWYEHLCTRQAPRVM